MEDRDKSELQKEALKQLIMLAAAAATVALYAIGQRQMSDPDYLTRLRMRLADKARNRVSKTARRLGRMGMAAELDGNEQEAQAWYSSAYKVMTRYHERLSAWYERQRG